MPQFTITTSEGTTATAWASWTTTSTASTTATWDDGTAAWTTWVTTRGTSAATTDVVETTWIAWVEGADGTRRVVARSASAPAYRAPEPTPEEKAEREKARREREEREKAERAEREERERAADARAEELLLAHLDEAQKAEYARDKSFTVRCRKGRRYRVHRAWGGHVVRLPEPDRPGARLCIHPRALVPLPDNQLMAKLLLEADPDLLEKTANHTPLPAGVN